MGKVQATIVVLFRQHFIVQKSPTIVIMWPRDVLCIHATGHCALWPIVHVLETRVSSIERQVCFTPSVHAL